MAGRPSSQSLPAVISLCGGQVQQTSKFMYLGSIVTSDCTFEADASARIGKAAGAFQGLRHVWDAPTHALGVGLKSVIYRTCVLPVLLFGSESWAISDGLVSRLDSFQGNCLRQILGVRRSDRHRNEYLYDRCAEHPIGSYLAFNRLRQLGHVSRMSHTRLPKLALWCAAPGLRPRGRPRFSWFDAVRRDCAAIGINPAHLDNRCSNRLAWREGCLALLARRQAPPS